MSYSILQANRFRFPFLTERLAIVALAIILIAVPAAAAADDIKQIEEDARRQLKLAEKLTKKGEWGAAEKILRELLSRAPQHSAAKLDLAYLLLKQKKVLEAYDLSLGVARAEPKNSYAFAVLGAALLNAGNFREANALFINALNINKKEPLAWAGFGMLDFYENRINDAIENLRIAVYLDAEEPDYIFTLAQVTARAERYKEAADAYRRFLQVSPPSDVERRDRIKGLISFLSFLGGKQSLYDLGGNDQTVVSVELVRDRPIIRLRVNKNEAPLRFVLDTGSGISVISQETAARLGIKPVARGGSRAIGGDGKFQIVYGFLKSVHIGDVQVKSVPVYIRHFHSNDEKIDGYIGLSLISKFLTTLDYGNQTFTLVKKDVADKLKFDHDASPSLPLRLTSSGFLSGEVLLQGVENPLNFIVDTGASISVISDEVAGIDEISRFVQNEKMRVVGAAGVTENVPSFLLPRVSFGNNSREQIRAIALDLDIINEAAGFQQAGILGGNFLKNYRLTFDFKNSKVFFTPVAK